MIRKNLMAAVFLLGTCGIALAINTDLLADWNLVKDKNGIKVYMKHTADSL